MSKAQEASDKNVYDIREDEDQAIKLQEIIDLLIAAGYFRARIKGLSSFDKIVGGITWCMESCFVDVDVDILFQENSSIGQKIALTEKIVAVLPRMGCPHRIEPHQIQGLDFIHIFPVVQWLVKQSVTVREERREFLRDCAVREFDKRFRENDQKEKIIESFHRIQEEYRPRRSFMRTGSAPEDEVANVESTLMEYGLGDHSRISLTSTPFVQTEEVEHRIEPSVVNAIVNTQSEAIRITSQQFEDISLDVDAPNAVSNRMEVIKEQIQAEEEKNSRLNAKLNEIEASLLALKTDVNNKESNNNIGLYAKLENLVLMEKDLQEQESQFRDHCRSELIRLQNLAQEAEERSQNESEDAESVCESEKERINALRLQIAQKNRAVAQLQRRLDEIPGRAELAQYQRRFLELYSLVAQKHAETKQFYTMHNTLDDTRLYLAKELSLLNSVLDTYSEAMTSSLDKSSFIRQFEDIVAAIKKTRAKVESRRNDEKQKKERLSQQLLDLVELQRHYVAIVRQLKIEVKTNEALLSNLKALKAV